MCPAFADLQQTTDHEELTTTNGLSDQALKSRKELLELSKDLSSWQQRLPRLMEVHVEEYIRKALIEGRTTCSVVVLPPSPLVR